MVLRAHLLNPMSSTASTRAADCTFCCVRVMFVACTHMSLSVYVRPRSVDIGAKVIRPAPQTQLLYFKLCMEFQTFLFP